MKKTLACVLLAAGCGVRFGGDKLLTPVAGKTLIAHAVELHGGLPYVLRVAVIREGDAILQEQIDRKSFRIAYNPAPERGISSSLRIGLDTVLRQAEIQGIQLDGVLFSVSDQPRLKRDTVQRMIDLFSEHSDHIIAPITADGRRGNPVIFPCTLFSELLMIEGDRGGGVVINKHPESVLPYAVDEGELFDIDTRADRDVVDSGLARQDCC